MKRSLPKKENYESREEKEIGNEGKRREREKERVCNLCASSEEARSKNAGNVWVKTGVFRSITLVVNSRRKCVRELYGNCKIIMVR